MAVTASQLPSFDGQATLSLADLQALADCVRASMQTTEAPPGLRRIGSAKAVRAHSVPAGQLIYFSGVEVQTPSYFLPRPGLVQDIGWQAGLTQPCIVQGHVLLPLAQTHDGGAAMTSGIAGGISAAIVDPAITSPQITAGGVLRLPPAGEGGTVSAPLAYFGSGITQPVPGLVGSVSFDSETEAHANNGNVFLPLAYFTYFTDGEATRPGGIRAIYQAEDSAIDRPLILNGDIYLPTPSGVECPLAYFGSGQLSQKAGKIAGVIFNLGIESPECSAGVIQFPAADFNGPGATRFGAIGAISVDSSIDSPEIRNGEILLPAYGSSTSISGLRDYQGNPVPFNELGGGGAQRTLLARQLLSTSDGKGVGVELYASFDRGFLQFAMEPWSP